MTTPDPAPLVSRAPTRTYKADGRSRVWLVRDGDRGWAIKRYEYAPIRQVLARAIGLHPAQRERRHNDRLRRDGIDVVPIETGGVQGGRVWLATPERGEVLQVMLQQGAPAARGARNRLIADVIALWSALVEHGWFFRDFQVANIVVDDRGKPWLIDVGSTRRSRSPMHARRMLRQLYETARIEGLTRTDAWRAAKHAAAVWPEAGDARGLLRAIA